MFTADDITFNGTRNITAGSDGIFTVSNSRFNSTNFSVSWTLNGYTLDQFQSINSEVIKLNEQTWQLTLKMLSADFNSTIVSYRVLYNEADDVSCGFSSEILLHVQGKQLSSI